MLGGVARWGIHPGMTQRLLATMVADTAPADPRGTACGFFNLISGVVMLLASVCAGLLWDSYGATFTFYAGPFSVCLHCACLPGAKSPSRPEKLAFPAVRPDNPPNLTRTEP